MSAKSSSYKARCRGVNCGTDVMMIKADNGRYHPYDVPIPKCPECNGKGVITVQAPATLFEAGKTTEKICPKCNGKGERPVSHFRTCPNSEDFRIKDAKAP